MASCKLGHVYIVETVLTKPPKAKFAICVCVADGLFVWINTNAAPHGCDQIKISAGCHDLITHDSHIDLSRVVKHPDWELDTAKEFPCISRALCENILSSIDHGLEMMPQRHAKVIRDNLQALLV